MKSRVRAGLTLSLVTLTASCGGGIDPGNPQYPPPVPPSSSGPPTGQVSGTISGLQGSGLVLANAIDGRTLAVDAGATTFSFAVSNDYYNIVVLDSPRSPAQACTVTGGMGYGTQANSSATIECTSDVGLLGGTIVGLGGSGLELVQSNGDVVAPAAGDKDFAFATGLSSGMRYSVGVGHQPVDPSQTCTIRRGRGAMPDEAGVRDIAIECLDNDTNLLWGTYSFEMPSGAEGYMTFFADGTYSYVVRTDDPACGANDGNGVEYGAYRWDASDSYDPYGETGAGPFIILSAVVDTNGRCGLARSVGGTTELLSGSLEWNASHLQITTSEGVLVLTAVEQATDQLLGSFEPGTVKVNSSRNAARVNRTTGAFTVFLNDGSYVSVETQDAPEDGLVAGAEWGCAAWSPYVLVQSCGPGDSSYLDLNGTGGLSERFRYGHGDIGLSLATEWMVMNSGPSVGYLDYFWWKITSGGS